MSPASEEDVRAGRRELFAPLADPETQAHFWKGWAEDVDRTVLGTHPLAGRYRGRLSSVPPPSGGWQTCCGTGLSRLRAVAGSGSTKEMNIKEVRAAKAATAC